MIVSFVVDMRFDPRRRVPGCHRPIYGKFNLQKLVFFFIGRQVFFFYDNINIEFGNFIGTETKLKNMWSSYSILLAFK